MIAKRYGQKSTNKQEGKTGSGRSNNEQEREREREREGGGVARECGGLVFIKEQMDSEKSSERK
jgi:hypothetical protein